MTRISEHFANHEIRYFGQEQEPVVIIDAFSGRVEELLAKARAARYEPAGANYPGLSGLADVNYLAPQGKLLTDIAYRVFGFETGLSCQSCYFSMVTTPRGQLSVPQRLPHNDASDANLLAGLHYLLGPETGGTAFYRHKRTGFETITPERSGPYAKALQADHAEYGDPPSDYFYASNERYDCIGEIEAKPDRFILYRGRTLHSGIIPAALPLQADPWLSRITINTFMTSLG